MTNQRRPASFHLLQSPAMIFPPFFGNASAVVMQKESDDDDDGQLAAPLDDPSLEGEHRRAMQEAATKGSKSEKADKVSKAEGAAETTGPAQPEYPPVPVRQETEDEARAKALQVHVNGDRATSPPPRPLTFLLSNICCHRFCLPQCGRLFTAAVGGTWAAPTCLWGCTPSQIARRKRGGGAYTGGSNPVEWDGKKTIFTGNFCCYVQPKMMQC